MPRTWSHMLPFDCGGKGIAGEVAVSAEIDGETFDISGALRPLMTEEKAGNVAVREEPLVVPVSGGWALMLTSVFVTEARDEGGNSVGDGGEYLLGGYLCW